MGKLSDFGYTKECCAKRFPNLSYRTCSTVVAHIEDITQALSVLEFRNAIEPFVQFVVTKYDVPYSQVVRALRIYTQQQVLDKYEYNVSFKGIDTYVHFRGKDVPLEYACRECGYVHKTATVLYNRAGRAWLEDTLTKYDENPPVVKTQTILIDGEEYTISKAGKVFNVSSNLISQWLEKWDNDTVAAALLNKLTPYRVTHSLLYDGKLRMPEEISLLLQQQKFYISQLVHRYNKNTVQQWLNDGVIEQAITNGMSVQTYLESFVYKGKHYTQTGLGEALGFPNGRMYTISKALTHAEIQEALDTDRLDILENTARHKTVNIFGRTWGLRKLATFLNTYYPVLTDIDIEEFCSRNMYQDRLQFEAISPEVTHITADLWTYTCPICGRIVLCRTSDLINFRHDDGWCKLHCVDEEEELEAVSE